MDGIVINGVDTPAMNKWGKMFPSQAKLLLGLGVHNYLGVGFAKVRRGILQALHSVTPAGGPTMPAEADGGDCEGLRMDQQDPNAPTLEAKTFKVLSRTRKARASHFVCNPDTTPFLCIYLCCAFVMMSLHFLLFSSGKMGHRVGQDDASRAKHLNRILDFAQPKRSPALRIMQRLTDMLLVTSAAFSKLWSLVLLLLGTVDNWEHRYRERAHASACVLLGQVYRRLIVDFLKWPWCLAEAIDERNTLSERQAARDRLYTDCSVLAHAMHIEH